MRDKPESLNGPIPWVRIEDFAGKYIGSSRSQQGVSSQLVATMNLKVFPVGTVLCSCSCTMGATAIVKTPLVSNQTFIGLVPGPNFLSDYLYYFFLHAAPHLNSLGTGAIQAYLSRDDFRQLRLPRPPMGHQAAIARFLDREAAKLDELIAEQEKLIALLAEKRQATIFQAVTRGLDASAAMKDSGVPWLGHVPAHWEVKRLRHWAMSIQTGSTPTSESPLADIEPGLDWYTPGDFDQGLALGRACKRVSRTVVESGDAKVFPAGSILIVSIGATLGKVGLTTDLSSANQQINAVQLEPNCHTGFFAYSLSVKVEQMRFVSNASTIGIMNQEKTKEIVIAAPPLHEQREIAEFLDQQGSACTALQQDAVSAAALLKERRSALITAAVTGQIDVRGAVTA